MSLEVVLFVLRVVSAIALSSVLIVIFLMIWRDYKGTMEQTQARHRSYGALISLHEIDSVLVDGEAYPLLPLTSLGRSPTNTVVIDDSYASGTHAIVSLREGQWWLQDQQSRNGTRLNEKLISQPVVMTDGDVIEIGSHRFRIELDRSATHKR